MIHPFNDFETIAGQGTIGVEILRSCSGRELDAIFVCCGGGGMLSGVAAYLPHRRGRSPERAAGGSRRGAVGSAGPDQHAILFGGQPEGARPA